ncbi:MAG: ATP-binding protein [Deltaproteobacteria bacterium]|nr:ATP-binding protein [Deltaproteobacteria bacterium]
MKRLQEETLLKDLEEKMVFLSGPRQVGKTTLAKSLGGRFPSHACYNYDEEADRRIMVKKTWDRKVDLIVLDEIHKLKKWKTHLKGAYDTEGIPPRILVTGSARLDVFRRGGDSLAGRYFGHRLYPFSVRELRGEASPREIVENLIRYGGFPEPFLSQSEMKTARWRKQHIERIVRIDVQDLEPVRDIQTLILLIDMLKERVGSPISYNSLSRDLQISPHTVKRWIQILESMYVVFSVTPYSKNISRSLLKEPKIYFYDTSSVTGDEGIKFENLVANCLRKHLHFLEDAEGKTTQLHYLRDKEKREADFLTAIDKKIEHLVEVKFSNANLSRPLLYFHRRLSAKSAIQLVMNTRQTQTVEGISILPAGEWLDTLAA